MNIKVEAQINNVLLNRKELIIKVESDITPKKQELIDTLSTNLKVDKELIVIDYIDQKFGEKQSTVHAKVYDSLDNLKTIEPKPKEKKEKPKAEEGEEAPAAEGKPEEKPKEEEKKEEAKEEKKEEPPKEEKPKEAEKKEEAPNEQPKEEKK